MTETLPLLGPGRVVDLSSSISNRTTHGGGSGVGARIVKCGGQVVTTYGTALQHEHSAQHAIRLRTEIARLQHQVAGDRETERLRARLDEARARKQELERRVREVDRDTEDRRARTAARERELMSGHIGSPAGLMKLRQEVEHLQQALGEAEDRELALLEDVDRQDAEMRTLEETFEHRRAEVAGASPQLRERLEAANAELERVEAEVRSTWEDLPPEWQRAIERIHDHHADAVAEMSDGLCGACHVAVTSSGRQALRHGALLTCDNCGRLLVPV